jgi:hypothetical protein
MYLALQNLMRVFAEKTRYKQTLPLGLKKSVIEFKGNIFFSKPTISTATGGFWIKNKSGQKGTLYQ